MTDSTTKPTKKRHRQAGRARTFGVKSGAQWHRRPMRWLDQIPDEMLRYETARRYGRA